MADDAPAAEEAAAAPRDAAFAPPPTYDRNTLLRQLEYYFSDVRHAPCKPARARLPSTRGLTGARLRAQASFPFDNFLMAEKDDTGAIGAETLAAFPKVVALTPALSPAERADALHAVAAKSDTVVPCEADGAKRIRRRYPLPSEDPSAPRMVWLQGFSRATGEEAIREMAAKFGTVVSVRRLRELKKERLYNGQVFVEMESEAEAGALVKALPTPAAARPTPARLPPSRPHRAGCH